MQTVAITAALFDPHKLAKEFRAAFPDAGAVTSFTGFVRGEAGQVSALELSHYPGMTEAEIERVIAQAQSRWDLQGCHVTHRVGKMAAGEAIVFVTAASAHRRDAFEAVDFIMDYLKSEAPFWKKETGQDGSHWIEPRQSDKADLNRWTSESRK